MTRTKKKTRTPLHARPVWVKGFLLLLTIYPFAYTAWFLVVMLREFSDQSARLPVPGGLFFGLHLTAMAAILAVVVIYALDVRREERIDAGHQTFWQSFAVFGNPVSLLVYWWQFVRRSPNEVSTEASLPPDLPTAARLLLGVASLLPLAFMVTVVAWAIADPPVPLMWRPGDPLWAWVISGVLGLALELYFVRDVHGRPELEGSRGSWVFGLLAFGPFVMPVYWWRFIRPGSAADSA